MTVASVLNTSGTVTLATVNGVTGYGLIRFSPAGEKWEVNRIHVECTTRVNEAQARIYYGFVNPASVVDGTYSGSTGDTTDTPIYLEDGQAMFIEWQGGDNGATATVSVSGWKSAPDGGFRAVH